MDSERVKFFALKRNTVLKKWMAEWIQKERAKKNVTKVTQYELALQSLNKFPLQIHSGETCFLLEHFDSRLCAKISQKMKSTAVQLDQENDLVEHEPPIKKQKTSRTNGPRSKKNGSAGSAAPGPSSAAAGPSSTVPGPSSAHTDLLTAEAERIIQLGQHLASPSSSTKTQQPKNPRGKKREITETSSAGAGRNIQRNPGKQLTSPCRNRSPQKSKDPRGKNSATKGTSSADVGSSSQRNAVIQLASPTENRFTTEPECLPRENEPVVICLPGYRQTLIILDTATPTFLMTCLLDATIETRPLAIGDMMWVCRNNSGEELVFPFIVKFKRWEDLRTNIIEGTFENEKNQLITSGFLITYVIEGYEELTEDVPAAISPSLLTDAGFLIVHTKNSLDRTDYVHNFTKTILEKYMKLTLMSCTRNEFDLKAALEALDDPLDLITFNSFNRGMKMYQARNSHSSPASCAAPKSYPGTDIPRTMCEERENKVISTSSDESPPNDGELPLLSEPSHSNTGIMDHLMAPGKMCGKRDLKPILTSFDEDQSDDEQHPVMRFSDNREIIMLVDSAEPPSDNLRKTFDNSKIKFEMRSLKVGDYLWIARNSINEELVLPFVVERKKWDDLSHSLKDGRYKEQKFRLKMCGLSVIYLIEGNKSELSKYSIKLSDCADSAKISCMVEDDFTVENALNSSETSLYLCEFTKYLQHKFKFIDLMGCTKENFDLKETLKDNCGPLKLMTFNCFSCGMGKYRTFSVREMFVKQLVQIVGLSASMAMSLTSNYPTPAALIQALTEVSTPEAISLLTEIRHGLTKQCIGPTMANIIYKFYTAANFT